MDKEKKIYQLSPEAKSRKQEYIKRYGKANYAIFSFKLRKTEDEELIKLIKSSELSTCALVKEALLEYFGK